MATKKKIVVVKKVLAKKRRGPTLFGSLTDPDNLEKYDGAVDFEWFAMQDYVAECCGLSSIGGFEVSERVADGKTSITVFDKDFLNDCIKNLPDYACIATTIIGMGKTKLPRWAAATNNVLKALGFVKAKDFKGNSGNHLRLWIRVPKNRAVK